MNFIKTTDNDMKKKLKELGFPLMSENGNVATFLNQNNMKFEDVENLIYTNKIEMV